MQLGNSLMAARIRDKDWSSTPLGPRESWPLELTTTLGLILDSAFPLYLLWGDQLLNFFNDSYAKVLGKKPDALGRPFEEVWAEVWDELAPLIDSARAGEATFHENKRLVLDRGVGPEETWWTFSLSPVRDGGNRVAGVLCTTWETTKLVLAEREAVRQAGELARFSALVPELLWVTRTPNEVHWANQRMIDFLGLDPTTFGADWPSIVHPDDVQAVALRAERSHSRRSTFESRHRLRRADGAYRWVLARSEPVFGPDGEVEAWYSAATDMHDWHLAAEAMRSKDELFETFARSSRKVLWIVDVATRAIEYLGGDKVHLWGERTAARIASWDDWFDTIHPEDRDQQLDWLPRLQNGELLWEEYRVIGDDGEVRNVRETLFPIPDGEGRIRAVGGIAERIDAEEVQQVYLLGFAAAHQARLASCFRGHGFRLQTFDTVDQFVKIAPALQPGCILFATAVPNSLGRILGALGSRRGAFPLVALTADHEDAGEVRSLMKMGAFDVLPELGGCEEGLLHVVRDALQSLSSAPADPLSTAQAARERLVALSVREREVLTRLMAGLSSKQIAIELGLSPRTVEVHRAKIKEKLQVSTLSEALALAASAGLS